MYALPIARRITLSPRSLVVATKICPLSQARRASSSLSAPSCLKQTVEKCRGAESDQPGSACTHVLEERSKADVLADQGLQSLASVPAQHHPQLERTEATAEGRAEGTKSMAPSVAAR